MSALAQEPHLHIAPVAKVRVHLVVAQRREATVPRRRIHWQQVHPAHSPCAGVQDERGQLVAIARCLAGLSCSGKPAKVSLV